MGKDKLMNHTECSIFFVEAVLNDLRDRFAALTAIFSHSWMRNEDMVTLSVLSSSAPEKRQCVKFCFYHWPVFKKTARYTSLRWQAVYVFIAISVFTREKPVIYFEITVWHVLRSNINLKSLVIGQVVSENFYSSLNGRDLSSTAF